MDKIEVKKHRATFDQIKFKDSEHPNKKVFSASEKLKWYVGVGNEWLASLEYKAKGYDGNTIKRKVIMTIPSRVAEGDIEDFVKEQLLIWEIELQDEEIERIKKEIIIPIDEYEVE